MKKSLSTINLCSNIYYNYLPFGSIILLHIVNEHCAIELYFLLGVAAKHTANKLSINFVHEWDS